MKSGFVNEIKYVSYKLDANMRIIYADDNFTKLTGYTKEDIQGGKLSQQDLIFEEDREEYFLLVQKNIEKTGEAYIEHRIRCKNGDERFVFCLGQAMTDKDGNPISVVHAMDVTKLVFMRIQADKIRKESEDELEQWMQAANTDELTGVLRRGAFLPTINDLVKKEKDYTLLIIDVDDFKNVNDRCGHTVGDEVLKALADTFRRAVRDNDLICRIGGDEFSIFLQDIGSTEKAVDIAKRIINEVNKMEDLTEGKATVHVSIGGRVHNRKNEFDLKKMFGDADEALYAAKSAGKNCYVIK